MIRLVPRDHGAAMGLYRAAGARFPLIGAVLLDQQNGGVFVDNLANPTCAYVEHVFGFAQVLGQPTGEFATALERYLLVDRNFVASKIRLYTPELPGFLEHPRHDSLRSLRQRFVLDEALRGGAGSPPRQRTSVAAAGEVVVVSDSNLASIDEAFGAEDGQAALDLLLSKFESRDPNPVPRGH